jgi:hypothetical protein
MQIWAQILIVLLSVHIDSALIIHQVDIPSRPSYSYRYIAIYEYLMDFPRIDRISYICLCRYDSQYVCQYDCRYIAIYEYLMDFPRIDRISYVCLCRYDSQYVYQYDYRYGIYTNTWWVFPVSTEYLMYAFVGTILNTFINTIAGTAYIRIPDGFSPYRQNILCIPILPVHISIR